MTDEATVMDMTREYIEQHAIIERYLTGTLDAEELDAFETLLLFSEETRAELEEAEREAMLREGLRAVAQSGAVTTQTRNTDDRGGWGRMSLATAAAAVLGAGLTFFATQGVMQADAGAGITTANVFALDTVRSAIVSTFRSSASMATTGRQSGPVNPAPAVAIRWPSRCRASCSRRACIGCARWARTGRAPKPPCWPPKAAT